MTAQRLDELTTRVLAPNPSPMTLEGTNTYLVGAPGSGEVIVVDPGPDLLPHREAVTRVVAARDAEVVAVVITHHHADHAEATGWAQDWGVEAFAFTPRLLAAPASPLRDGEAVQRAGVRLEALHTPGHASDHVCLRLAESGVVLTGDHVLGRGTTVVAWPDGDMVAYLSSLERLLAVDAPLLYPGHGPVVERPAALVHEYLKHRAEREQQVLAALAAGDATPAEIVVRVYADADPLLHPAAERSVRAHLDKLVAEDRVRTTSDGRYALT